MARFQPVLRSARFVYSPYAPQEMAGFAQVLANAVRARIESGQNIYDQPAAPLSMHGKRSERYYYIKRAKGKNPIRDWTWSGHTLNCMGVLEANENRAVIGFLSEVNPIRDTNSATAARIASVNNWREVQFGTSPRDKQVVRAAFSQHKQRVSIQATGAAA